MTVQLSRHLAAFGKRKRDRKAVVAQAVVHRISMQIGYRAIEIGRRANHRPSNRFERVSRGAHPSSGLGRADQRDQPAHIVLGHVRRRRRRGAFRDFRGRDATVEALMRDRGIAAAAEA